MGRCISQQRVSLLLKRVVAKLDGEFATSSYVASVALEWRSSWDEVVARYGELRDFFPTIELECWARR